MKNFHGNNTRLEVTMVGESDRVKKSERPRLDDFYKPSPP